MTVSGCHVYPFAKIHGLPPQSRRSGTSRVCLQVNTKSLATKQNRDGDSSGRGWGGGGGGATSVEKPRQQGKRRQKTNQSRGNNPGHLAVAIQYCTLLCKFRPPLFVYQITSHDPQAPNSIPILCLREWKSGRHRYLLNEWTAAYTPSFLRISILFTRDTKTKARTGTDVTSL